MNKKETRLTRQVTVRMDIDIYDRIEKIAKETERDQSKVIRKIVKDFFAMVDRGEVEFR